MTILRICQISQIYRVMLSGNLRPLFIGDQVSGFKQLQWVDGIYWKIEARCRSHPTACQFRIITDVRADKSCAWRLASTFQLADVKVYCLAGCTSMWDHLFSRGPQVSWVQPRQTENADRIDSRPGPFKRYVGKNLGGTSAWIGNTGRSTSTTTLAEATTLNALARLARLDGSSSL
jgi:hypothetical protein